MKKELHECEICKKLFKLTHTEEMFIECVGVCAPTVCQECKEQAKEAERQEQEGE